MIFMTVLMHVDMRGEEEERPDGIRQVGDKHHMRKRRFTFLNFIHNGL